MSVFSPMKLFVLSLCSICFAITTTEAYADGFSWPTPGCGNVVTQFGKRGNSSHGGFDISCDVKEPVVAMADGIVSGVVPYKGGSCTYDSKEGTCPITNTCNADTKAGNYVSINHGNGIYSFYMHLDSIDKDLKYLDPIKCGQQIGIMGNTGCSTGTHLHFEIRKNGQAVSPHDYVKYGDACVCIPSEEICDGKDNDCNGQVDEDSICDIQDEIKFQSMMFDKQSTDVNGDGKADLCARGYGGLYCAFNVAAGSNSITNVLSEIGDTNGFTNPDKYATLKFADINGDGKADVCIRNKSNIKCWIFDGTKFSKSITGPSMADADKYNATEYYSTIRFADVTGDGKDDFCARFTDGFKCFPSTGEGFANPISINDMKDSGRWNNPQYYSTIRVGDINGDGKYDICGRGSSGVRCWISNGSSFTAINANEWNDAKGWDSAKYYLTIRLADINGDGKADICARDKDGIICQLSNGTSFGPAIRGPNWSNANGWNDLAYSSSIHLEDINNDGKADICARSKDGFICHLSNGNGFGTEYSASFFSNANGWNKPIWFRTIRLGDIDGDGYKEVCGRNSDGIICFKFTDNGFETTSLPGPGINDANGWKQDHYALTFRFGGPKPACTPSPEICDAKDNDCDGAIDEDNVCNVQPECTPTDEICDQIDNDCDGQIDEDNVCDVPQECSPSDEICDQIDNDCDGQIDEDGVCPVPPECSPSDEICDQIDNDCDGQIDEDGVCDDDSCPNGTDKDGHCIDDTSSDTEQINLYMDDDCTCSSTYRSPRSIPLGALFSVIALTGTILIRRRRDGMRN